jgi:hypothetical protein
MAETLGELEARLDSFDRPDRDAALEALLTCVADGTIRLPEPEPKVNLHVHSFYSYNALGYSPTRIVWRARREGLRAVGLVDFDVFDGVDEFHRAGELLGIPTVAGMETRAYIPEFATREISSPGEPGITYHMIMGVGRSAIDNPEAKAFAEMLRRSARSRNETVVDRVNAHLDPVALDYETDVLPLSPSGTPTERHLCSAYQRKAETVLPEAAERVAFWADRLSAPAETVAGILDNDRELQALIRSKTMKRGGIGYQAPTPETFPLMTDTNRFALSIGALPMITWLDGTSDGEQSVDELMALHMAAGAAALNIVPDRNWNVGDSELKKTKVANLYDIVERANALGLPIGVGTEMNAPGLKFCDTFDAPELAPVAPSFLRGAEILVGHTAAILAGEPGYTRDRAPAELAAVETQNEHFIARGQSWRRPQ